MRAIHIITIALVLVSTLAGVATAENARTVGDYRFITSSFVRDPFITGHFRNSTGVSIANGVNLPLLILPTDPPDTLLSLEGNFVYIQVELEYQHAVNSRFSLRAGGHGSSRVGISGESIVSQGVSAAWGLDLGSTFAIWEGGNVRVAGLADVKTGKVLAIDLLGYVDDILNDNSNVPSLVKAEDRTSLLGGASAAWAFNSWSGLIGFFEAGYSHGSSTKGNGIWMGAINASVDFGQRGQAPVAVMAGLRLEQEPDVVSFEDEVSQSLAIGVFFTGREDFDVGGDITWSSVPLEFSDSDAHPVTFSAVLRYFF